MEDNPFIKKIKQEMKEFNKVDHFEKFHIVFWKLILIGFFLVSLLILVLSITFFLGQAFEESLGYLPVELISMEVVGITIIFSCYIFFLRGKVLNEMDQSEKRIIIGYKAQQSEANFFSMIRMFFDFCSYTFYSILCLDKIEKKKKVYILPEDINDTARLYEYIVINIPTSLADLYHEPSLLDISTEEKNRLLKPLLTMNLFSIDQNKVIERINKTSGTSIINFR